MSAHTSAVRADHGSAVEIRVCAPAGAAVCRTNEPVTVGIPLPRGRSFDTTGWRLLDGHANPVPLQARVLGRWSDGSIRWVLLDFQACVPAVQPSTLVLSFDGDTASSIAPGISVSRSSAGYLTIDTGGVQFRVDDRAPFLFSTVLAAGRPATDCSRNHLRIVTEQGRPCEIRWTAPVIEEAGALRCAVRIDGHARAGSVRLLLVARLHFFAGSAAVRLLLTVRNPSRAAHPGGIWELGDRGSTLLKEISIVLERPACAPAQTLSCSARTGEVAETCSNRLEVYQESSGGDNWQSRNHVNRRGVVPLSHRGYRLLADATSRDGLRATPVVLSEGAGITVGATIPRFWQEFPKALAADARSVTVALFPPQFPDLHELQGGEQKTHECWLLFGPDVVTERPFDWCRARLMAHASPEWYACSGAVSYLTSAANDSHADYLALVASAIEGAESFEQKRERVDEYGWRNYGDISADHEGVLSKQRDGFVSHYNNQYDAAFGLGVHFLRTGDPRWWVEMDALVRHVFDIDIYHTDEDKAAYNHGAFWHTTHYVHAGKSSHRSYPAAPGVAGGGPACEHDYTSGLMLHYFLTGEEASREAVLELAGWVLDMDDGRKSSFRWAARGDTGLASATGSPCYHGPGRGAANSILTLLNAHTLTGQPRYLEKAEQLIGRCIHPSDDIAALNLLDAERRWYYTVFLQVLARYLHYSTERGELDRMYAYARASLLHYARWMAVREYPYLDKPDILEYPNETWAAQDMRKSEVFMQAALCACGEERARFDERARFFFDYSISKLPSMPTHVLTRPTVLMLVNGYMRSWYAANCRVSLPRPARAFDFGQPCGFVPQKVRAARRVKLLAATGGAFLAALAGLVVLLAR